MVTKKVRIEESGAGNSEPLASASEEVLEQAARLTSHFALLEYGVRELAHVLLGVPENIARTVTGKLSFDETRNLAASLVAERVPAHGNELKRLFKLIKRIEEIKDGITCFLWGREMAQGRRRSNLPQGLSSCDNGELKASELGSIVAELAVATHDIERLRHRIRTEMHAGQGIKP